jgi:phosphatidylinositol alpha-mannosyltransferase
MRICLVTPFAWSQPHDVNEHVAGIAGELRGLGHAVTVLAPSTRNADLVAGRRALARGEQADLIAIGAAVPVSRRSRLGVPVGVSANLRLALEQGRFDVVHGFEPGLPSISYLSLRDSKALGVATFVSPERLGFPPRRALREKLLARIDALLATSETTAAAAAERFPGDFRVVSPGVDAELFAPAPKRQVVVIELHSGSLPVARAALRSLRELPGWEAVLLRTKPLATRPPIPHALRDRVSVRSGRRPATRAAVLADASIVVPAPTGSARLRLEAMAAGAALAEPPGVAAQPELAAAAVARLAEDEALRKRRGDGPVQPPRRRASPSSPASSTTSTRASGAAAARRSARPTRSRAARGSSPTCTCTRTGRTTARSTSTSCSTMPRPRASARSRSPTTTSSAARSRRSRKHAGEI